MSSDLFEVRVAKVDGTKVTLDVLTDTAGGVDDLCTSRSFALLCLEDCLRRATDIVRSEANNPKKEAEVHRLYAKADNSALHQALPSTDESDWFVNKQWMQENVGRFIESCKLVERRNHLSREELEKREEAIEEKFDGLRNDNYHLWQPARWKDCHNYTLEVVVTDPKWAQHLEVGLHFGTTAYDVWSEKAAATP
jgi:hypothetical protein